MENQHKEIIESCIAELGANDLDLNNLSNDFSRRSITEDRIFDLRSRLISSIERIDSRLNDSYTNSDSKELLEFLKCELLLIQDRIHRACDSFDGEKHDGDRLLSQVLARNHRVFFELVKIRDA
jgi:hypothetical protein